MKLKIIIILETAIIVFALLSLSCTYINEHQIMTNSQWFREISPDEKYIIVANIDNHTLEWFYVQIRIFNEKHESSTFMIAMKNQGRAPNEKNYRLEWHNEYVKLTTITDNGSEKTCRLYWEDLDFRDSNNNQADRFIFN